MIRSSEQSHGDLFLHYYWGVGREGTGQNRLGKITERIRAELRAQAS